jgi:hypothetical protein
MIRFDGKTKVNKDDWLYKKAPLDDCINFTHAVILQGNRLKCAMVADRDKDRDESFDLRKVEEDFFVYALDRAVVYLQELAGSYYEFNPFLEKIYKKLGRHNIKNVRDMRTHSNEYRIGKGKFQKKFYTPTSMYKGILGKEANVDATSSVLLGNCYQIGGRIDFNKAMNLFEKLLPGIVKLCNEKHAQLFSDNHKKLTQKNE